MIKDLVKEEEFHIAIGLNLVEEMKPKELLETNQRRKSSTEASFFECCTAASCFES